MAGEANQSGVIELRLGELAQLFNSLDPSPFHQRDLDDDAEAHIVGWARELPDDQPLCLVVHLPEAEAAKARERGLETALANYFSVRAEATDRDLRELFRVGRRNLSIGLPVLVACLLASSLTRSLGGTGPFVRALEESFVIFGWVANWKPIETFLYDWWPVKRQRDLYRRLTAAIVEIRPRG